MAVAKKKGKAVGLAKSPEVKIAGQLTTRLVRKAKALVINTMADYRAAAAQLQEIKAGIEVVDTERKKITDPLTQALEAARELFRPMRAQLVDTETAIKAEMSAFHDRQERARQEAQDEADARAEAERERLEKLANKARKSGKRDKAQELDMRAAMVVSPVLAIAPPKVSGIAMREDWYYEIIDPSKIRPAFLAPDEIKISAQISAVKNAAEAVEIIGEGIRVWSKKVPAAKAAT